MLDKFTNLGFGEKECRYLNDVYNAIIVLGLWDEFKQFSPNENEGFMFSTSPLLRKINSEMKLFDEHSGSSYGWTMRQIHFLIKNDKIQYSTAFYH